MKKVIKIQNLHCGNCAAQIEQEVGKLEEIEKVKVQFLTEKMTLTCRDDADLNEIMTNVKKICKRVEPDCELIF